jgi:hypothetical protein
LLKGSMMITSDLLNLWEAADELHIEAWRLSRLGRYLRLDPSEKRIPVDDVREMAALGDPEHRYAAVRSWLLGRVNGRITTT